MEIPSLRVVVTIGPVSPACKREMASNLKLKLNLGWNKSVSVTLGLTLPLQALIICSTISAAPRLWSLDCWYRSLCFSISFSCTGQSIMSIGHCWNDNREVKQIEWNTGFILNRLPVKLQRQQGVGFCFVFLWLCNMQRNMFEQEFNAACNYSTRTSRNRYMVCELHLWLQLKSFKSTLFIYILTFIPHSLAPFTQLSLTSHLAG